MFYDPQEMEPHQCTSTPPFTGIFLPISFSRHKDKSCLFFRFKVNLFVFMDKRSVMGSDQQRGITVNIHALALSRISFYGIALY